MSAALENLDHDTRDVTAKSHVGHDTVENASQSETTTMEDAVNYVPENMNRYRGVRDNCVQEKSIDLDDTSGTTPPAHHPNAGTESSTSVLDSSVTTSTERCPECDAEIAIDTIDEQLPTAVTRKEPVVFTRLNNDFVALSKPELQSLPLDSLHYVASFLTPSDWCNGFGLINKTSRDQSREIVRRVRMHAFKCASEVICAWKLGQWEDARELAALYVEAGVPIYSSCLGHSFHTLNWRMKVEATEIRSKPSTGGDTGFRSSLPGSGSSSSNNAEAATAICDSFFGSTRTEFRSIEGYGRKLTYLEEKCLFWLDQDSPAPRINTGQSQSRHPSYLRRNEDGAQRRSVSPPPQHVLSTQRKIPMVIHQHLLDRHNAGEYYINDQDGRMVTPMIVLSADFFHPSARMRRASVDVVSAAGTAPIGLPVAAADDRGWLSDDELPNPPSLPPILSSLGDIAEQEERVLPRSVLSAVVLEAYSSTVPSSLDCLENNQEVQRHLRSRFATYHRRLESFLIKDDLCAFEECILDFWDEFLPHSAGIHYYDLHSPVPRMSCMNKFLTTPCPKAIGVVQCEIERIRITTRGKGVNVKGRFFPTYEYRLFIRNRPVHAVSNPEIEEQDDFVRRDTVLMVAKNRGRKHTEPSGVVPLSAAPKKGSNNYYLYVPQQMDVDDHFTICNEHISKQARLEPNGASRNPVLISEAAGTVLLGRLQSNFIGTEFQIFTPRLRKLPRAKPELTTKTSHPFCSDDEHDDDSGVSSDTGRRYRFGRFLRSAGTNPGSDSGSVGQVSAMDRPRVTRTTSAPEFSEFTGRQPRTNRRAIANDALSSQPYSALCEEEGGAITYTANLLGSRPRIMDVCIPKVTAAGISGTEWKRYLESSDDTDDCRMLSCFRQLQQRRENHEQQNAGQDANEDDESVAIDESDFGLMALQNRPPWWNADLGSFVLNFGGRVSVASVKNFQLCERTNQDLIMLQFGRIKGRHSFTMDFQHPLTAVQAFSIAISSLQSKISFG